MAWMLGRQHTHGTRFADASFDAKPEAVASTEQYESGTNRLR
ncbi:MAG: hypothetical protein ACI88C_001094 [Acidimicrobiales bacterium]|jgi:hypothetical protein